MTLVSVLFIKTMPLASSWSAIVRCLLALEAKEHWQMTTHASMQPRARLETRSVIHVGRAEHIHMQWGGGWGTVTQSCSPDPQINPGQSDP